MSHCSHKCQSAPQRQGQGFNKLIKTTITYIKTVFWIILRRNSRFYMDLQLLIAEFTFTVVFRAFGKISVWRKLVKICCAYSWCYTVKNSFFKEGVGNMSRLQVLGQRCKTLPVRAAKSSSIRLTLTPSFRWKRMQHHCNS